MKFFNFFLIFLLSLNLSCAGFDSSSSHSTDCGPQNAIIQITDAQMIIRCGCQQLPQEKPGKVFKSGELLTCHLKSQSSLLFFLFSNNRLRHQINASGGEPFTPSSMLFDPNQEKGTLILKPIQFPKASTVYLFEDSFTSFMGQVIVP